MNKSDRNKLLNQVSELQKAVEDVHKTQDLTDVNDRIQILKLEIKGVK